MLEDGGSVENETLSDMFASLLACHLDPNQQELVHPSYTKVLAQLSPIDARLMVEFRKFTSDTQYRELGLRGGSQVVSFLAEMVNMPNRATYLSCLNLERLGIVQRLGFRPPEGHPHPDIFRDSMDHQEFRISEYGVAFWDACHYREA